MIRHSAKFLLPLALLAATFVSNAADYSFNTPQGHVINVECCTEDIFRINITPGQSAPESLMERYGLIRKDWKENDTECTETAELAVIRNGRFILTVDKAEAAISVRDTAGNTVVKSVCYLPSEAGLVKEMGDSLDRRYEWCKAQEAIIGNGKKARTRQVNDVGDTGRNSMLGFELEPDERFYGGGGASKEHIQHRGEILRIWPRYPDAGMTVPFMMSSKGWAVYNNATVRNYFDIGATDKDRMWIYNTQPFFDFYLLLGDDMLDALDLYTQVTGRATLMPEWAYGASFAGIIMEDMLDIMYDAVRFRDENIPMDLIWIEPQWMSKHYDWSTAKDWDYDKVFAVPFYRSEDRVEHKELLTGRLHDMGYKVALWLCVDTDHSVDEEDDIAAENGGTMSGREHWFDHLMRFVDQGVDGFKLDPGDTQEEHVTRQYYNGRSDREMHSINQVLMPKRMLKTFREHTGRRSYHHFCGAWAGTQHWTAQTCGDIGGGPGALFDQVNLSCSGFVNTSCDAYVVDKPSLHFGSLLPWMEINSWMALMQPWYMNDHDKAMFTDYLKLRNTLHPYIYSAAIRGSLTGRPMLMAMPLAFPDDRNVDDMSKEYMLGDNLLVSAFSEDIYLPEGKWIDYWTGEEFEGDGTTRAIAIPDNRGGHLFIRKGAIIPCQRQTKYIGQHPLDTLMMHVYPEGESSYTLYEDDGTSYGYEDGKVAATRFGCTRDGRTIKFEVSPAEGGYEGMYKSRTYEMTFHDIAKPSSVKVGGTKVKGWKYGDRTLSFTAEHPDTEAALSIVIR